jgi:hypothetical protein
MILKISLLGDEIVEFTPTFLGMMDTKSINIINNGEDMTLFELVPVECLHNNQDEKNHDSTKFLQFSPQVRPQISTIYFNQNKFFFAEWRTSAKFNHESLHRFQARGPEGR